MIFLFPYESTGKVYKTPYITYLIIFINIAVFIAHQVLNSTFYIDLKGILAAESNSPLYTIITHSFFHDNMFHLFLSMWIFYLCGCDVENKLKKIPYLFLYLTSAVFGYFFFFTFSKFANLGLVGSSSAVFGIALAHLILFPLMNFRVFYWFITYWGSVNIAGMFFIVPYLLLCNIKILPISNYGSASEIGGALVGIAVGAGYVIWDVLEKRLYSLKVRTRQVIEAAGLKDLKIYGSSKTDTLSEEKIRAKITADIEAFIANKDASSLSDTISKAKEIHGEFCLPAGIQRSAADLLYDANFKDLSEWMYTNLILNFPNAPITAKAYFKLGVLLGFFKKNYNQAIENFHAFLLTNPPLPEYSAASDMIDKLKKHLGEDVNPSEKHRPHLYSKKNKSRFSLLDRENKQEINERTVPPFSTSMLDDINKKKEDIEFPKPVDILSLDIEAESLEAFTKKGKYFIPLKNITLLSVGNIKAVSRTGDSGRVLDIFVWKPRCHLRIWEDVFNYSSSGINTHDEAKNNFLEIVRKVSSYSINARLSFPLEKMISEENPYPLSFESIEEFDNYNLWIRLYYR